MFLISLGRGRIADKWLVLIAVTLAMLMSIMDSTIVNVAIPRLRLVFGADIQHVQWVVTIYMVTQAAVIPTAPYLSMRFGAKRAYVWTLIAFLLGSVLCGFAWSLPSLILFRLIQGIGGGVLLPMVMTLLYQAFRPEERGTASSMMGVPLMIAPVLGPVLGGYLVTYFGWQWAFFINVPLGVVAVAIAQKVLEPTPGQPQTRFDTAGFLTAASGAALLLYAASGVTSGAAGARNILLLAAGIVLLLAFVAVEVFRVRHGQQPLLDLRRFKDRTFTLSIVALICQTFVVFGFLFLIPIYLQTLRGQTAVRAGTIQGAQALATMAILPLAGRLADKLGPRPIVLSGLLGLAGAMALLTTLALDTPIWMIVAILVLLGAAGGLAQQLPVAAMSRIQKDEHREVANGSTLLSVLRAFAAPMGVAVISSLVQAQSQAYRIRLATQGIGGDLLDHRSTLLGMHDGFYVAFALAVVAVVAMYFVPGRTRIRERSDLTVTPESGILS